MSDYSWEALIDLSKATKLKDVAFDFEDLSVAWVASTLKTITSRHRDLREVLIVGRTPSGSTTWPTNATAVGVQTLGQWVDLERTLIQLWESHAVRTEVKYYSGKGDESRELMENLLPEATKRGIVGLTDISISTVY